MLQRLRYAVPLLNTLCGYSSAAQLQLGQHQRQLWRTFGVAAAAESDHASTQGTDEAAADTAEPPPPPAAAKKKRTTRKAKATADPAAAVGPDPGAAAASTSDAPAEAPVKRKRASTPRKGTKAAAAATAAAAEGGNGEQLGAGDVAAAVPAAPAAAKKPRSRKKKEETGAATAAAGTSTSTSVAGATVEAAATDAAVGEGSAGADTAAEEGKGKAKGRGTRAKREVQPAEERPSTVMFRELPFEPFLVLPRKSERLLMAAGLMQPLPWHPLELRMAPGLRWNSLGVLPHQGPQADGAAEAKLGARDGPRRPPESLRDVMAIASWLHSEQKGAVTDLAAPLLCAAYQRAISPDDLYDLYKMDMGAPFLESDTVRQAALASLPQRPAITAAVLDKAMEKLKEVVGAEAVEAQEAAMPGLSRAQLDMFLKDWASARIGTGKGHDRAAGVLLQARRSAALMLDSEALIGRLHRYVVGGEEAGALCFKVPGSTDRSCKPVRVLDSLVEGVKAGVAMPYDRMLEDFWLAGKNKGLSLDALMEMTVTVASTAAEPGSGVFLSTVHNKLYSHNQTYPAVKEQERRWMQVHAVKDGAELTAAQIRLAFNVYRMERARHSFQQAQEEQQQQQPQ